MEKENSKTKVNKVLTGVSGEYFVAAELSRQGYIASITLRNTRGVDILVSNSEATKSAAIQVKTHNGSTRSWILSSKSEQVDPKKNFFYVFVNLNGIEKSPDYFVVPSKVVSDYITEGHQNWLKTPGKKGQAHNDSNMRKFSLMDDKYLRNWDILKL